MQTFLPYPDFIASAKSLDYRRLGKQRVEAWQIYLTLTKDSRWRNHPAVLMWKGYEKALCQYGAVMCSEWISRGYNDFVGLLGRFETAGTSLPDTGNPSWIGSPKFHIAHQSNLIRKKPEFYSPQWPTVPNNIEYIWPVRNYKLQEPEIVNHSEMGVSFVITLKMEIL